LTITTKTLVRFHPKADAETAVADGHEGCAVPAGHGAVGVPEILGVVVGMKVHEPGRHYQLLGVQDFVGARIAQASDLGVLAILNGQVADVAGRAGQRLPGMRLVVGFLVLDGSGIPRASLILLLSP